MKRILVWGFALLVSGLRAQWGPWTEEWTQGLGAWRGDTAAFAPGEGLRLNAPGAGTYALWRDGRGARPAVALGRIRLDFNPSSVNFAFAELLDTTAWTGFGASAGYRLEFGRTNDQLRLLRMPDGLVLAASPSGLLDRTASLVDWSWAWDSLAGHRVAWVLRDTLGTVLDSGAAWGNADSSVASLGRIRLGATVTATRVRGLRWGPHRFAASEIRKVPVRRLARRGDVAVTEILVDSEPRVSWRSAPGDFVELRVNADSVCWASGWTFWHGSGRWTLPDRMLYPGEIVVLADERMAWPDSLRVWNAPLALSASPAFWSLRDASDSVVAWGRTQPDMHQPAEKSLGGWSLEADPDRSELPRAWQSARSALGSSPGWIEFAPVEPRRGGILGLRADRGLIVDWRHPLPLGGSMWYPFDSAGLPRRPGGRWSVERLHSEATRLTWSSDNAGLGWPCAPGEVLELPLRSGWMHADGTPGDCTRVIAGWPVPPDSGELQISEVLFNPLPGEGRFVELRNLGGRVVDLSGLFWATADSGVWRRAAVAGSYLLPGGVVFVGADPAALLKRYPGGDSAAGPRGAPRPGAWDRPAVPGGPGATNQALPISDEGGRLELRRADAALLDVARLGPEHFPPSVRESPGKGEGMSLERRGPGPEDWGIAREDSATPGRWPEARSNAPQGRVYLLERRWPPALGWDLEPNQAWLLETRWADPEGRWATEWSDPAPVPPQTAWEARDEPPHRGVWLWEFRFTPSEGGPLRRSFPVRY